MVSGTQIEVWVDCSRVYRRLAPPPMTNLSALASLAPPLDPSDPLLSQDPSYRETPMALFLGQRNNKHFLFKVGLSHGRSLRGNVSRYEVVCVFRCTCTFFSQLSGKFCWDNGRWRGIGVKGKKEVSVLVVLK